jgi:hypothetical protein
MTDTPFYTALGALLELAGWCLVGAFCWCIGHILVGYVSARRQERPS